MQPSPSVPARAAVSILLLALPLAQARAQGTWMQTHELTQDDASALVFDSTRGRSVLLTNGPGRISDTWEWDGSAWYLHAPKTPPPPRDRHAMAYDSGRGRVVMFGGQTATQAPFELGDTWEWDGAEWTQRTPAHAPQGRIFAGMAYDPLRQRTVLFGGGRLDYSVLGDTWEWDGNDWQQLFPASHPAPRRGHKMVYDPGRARVVLLLGDSYPYSIDSWEWDGATWTSIHVTTAPPFSYESSSTVYDSMGRRILTWDHTRPGLWQWNGSTWSFLPSAQAPSTTDRASMAYDSVRGRAVLCSGTRLLALGGETHEWDGSTWQRRVAYEQPLKTVSYAMAYDAARGRAVLCGGGQTWERAGATWQRIRPTTEPPARTAAAMAFDAARNVVVLFGGKDPGNQYLDDTWEWNGIDWSQRTPATRPPPRQRHAMVYDEALGRVLLFGGDIGASLVEASVWEWNGLDWVRRSLQPAPPPRWGHTLAFDRARQKTVLFGGTGTSVLSDTWELDAGGWVHRFPAVYPPGGPQAMAYDPARGRIFLPVSDFTGPAAWEWDGVNWSRLLPYAGPPNLYYQSVAYDAAHGCLLLFGVGPNPSAIVQTWLYGDLLPATRAPYGAACTGTGGAPRLTMGMPFLGNRDVCLDLLSACPSSWCVFGLSPSTQDLPLGGGCTLYLGLPMLTIVTPTTATGFTSARLELPNDARFRGASAFGQAFVVDPLGSYAGFALSGGLRIVLGD